MFAWLKMLFGEHSDERFREGFQASKIALAPGIDLSRSGADYNDPVVQEDWANWIEYERSKINAW
ncbi:MULTISPECIES: hypothetical protein [Pseudomonas]|jgi:hypothetical protein|uniref:Uncharacterized protein n=2 Tax=Pseudomonas TaxID=286 RepID=A0A6L5BXF5_9PSED|nr:MULTISPECIES: hypothetical protein [Pseudomonas]KAF2393028.1 hypothetical protein FX983_00989 [Pseudomonas frederiksbergensis]MDN3220288.1 hypothetical protein [Pseudomonas nunensis]